MKVSTSVKTGSPLSYEEWRKQQNGVGPARGSSSRYTSYLKTFGLDANDLLVPPPPAPSAQFIADSKRKAPVGVADLKIFLPG
jgi:hypothetical protein